VISECVAIRLTDSNIGSGANFFNSLINYLVTYKINRIAYSRY